MKAIINLQMRYNEVYMEFVFLLQLFLNLKLTFYSVIILCFECLILWFYTRGFTQAHMEYIAQAKINNINLKTTVLFIEHLRKRHQIPNPGDPLFKIP